jgi:hypothetical protein
VSCAPCAERKARLLSDEPLPARDYAFYAGWLLAALGVGTAAYLYLHRKEAK